MHWFAFGFGVFDGGAVSVAESWGRYPKCPQQLFPVQWDEDIPVVTSRLAATTEGGFLAFGNGRSYGDSCMAVSGKVIAMRGMDRILSVDWESGVIDVQAGTTLEALIALVLPHGWFLPVTPGTKFATVGGAVANDVHGKNHHRKGTFGRHIKRLHLFRSDSGFLQCSPDEEAELFSATIGGLGLTGTILSVVLQLAKVQSSEIAQRTIKFDSLSEFFELSRLHDASHEYAVAWIDCLARGKALGRGHYILGQHMGQGELEVAAPQQRSMPLDPPFSLVNRASLRVFNTAYFHRQLRREVRVRQGYDPFFYPLDKLLHWNRIYGRAGFQQYQCVVPTTVASEAMAEILAAISRSGTGSFLAVLKTCGSLRSPGLMSFPMEGASLALDFAQVEPQNSKLFALLDQIVRSAGGRLYPAKDAHMSAADFQLAYPAWTAVEALRDPSIMSRFWARVTQQR